MKMVSLGRYGGLMRSVARAVRTGDAEACDYAARIYADALPRDAVIVPMPSHMGRAGTMLMVAERIAARRGDVTVCDCLATDPHESSYWAKREGRAPDDTYRVWTIAEPPRGRPLWIVDNCACSLTTAGKASAALPSASVMVLAKSAWR